MVRWLIDVAHADPHATLSRRGPRGTRGDAAATRSVTAREIAQHAWVATCASAAAPPQLRPAATGRGGWGGGGGGSILGGKLRRTAAEGRGRRLAAVCDFLADRGVRGCAQAELSDLERHYFGGSA